MRNPIRVPDYEGGVAADIRRGGQWLATGALSGLVCGALVGGLAGRLAMLVLRLTSDPSLRGLKTDDDFVIGAITPATLFLLFSTAAFGMFGGAVYLALRGWLPPPAGRGSPDFSPASAEARLSSVREDGTSQSSNRSRSQLDYSSLCRRSTASH